MTKEELLEEFRKHKWYLDTIGRIVKQGGYFGETIDLIDNSCLPRIVCNELLYAAANFHHHQADIRNELLAACSLEERS